MECPVCKLPLDGLPESGRQRHVNDCLDFGGGSPVKVTQQQGREPGPPSPPPSSSSSSGCSREEKQRASCPVAPASSCACPVCGEDITHLSLVHRQGHVSRCGQKGRSGGDGGERRSPRSKTSRDMKGEAYTCGICFKDLSRSTYEQRVAHVKKCTRSKKQAKAAGGDGQASQREPPAPETCVVDWLRSLGLEKHAEAFVREEVSLELVGTLTDSDLLTLGVSSLGARRKILTSVCSLPIPTTSITAEFQHLGTKKQKALRNNRRITQFMGKASSAVTKRQDGEGKKEQQQQQASQKRRRQAKRPFTEIGNSSLAVFGDKKSQKSLWSYAGE
ncbi:SAM domain-containing protein [Chloropicon primus]|nr:hypothetical protein A3770_13p68160 [Chloropicon primus]UPR03505.1 SAM domain-containing protein [Chloropicon primus]|eukprot:QDZ24298.1 hypothetical protein A3770_13p68160 [Chloropicon primus]